MAFYANRAIAAGEELQVGHDFIETWSAYISLVLAIPYDEEEEEL